MKIIKNIFKTILILLLLFVNLSVILESENTINNNIAFENLKIFNNFNQLNVNIENKMSVIYFYTKDTIDQNKYDMLKDFISNTDCNKIANFVSYEVDGNIPEQYIIYSTLTEDNGSNSVVLLDKLGSKLEIFTPDDNISSIQTSLKNIFKNYI